MDPEAEEVVVDQEEEVITPEEESETLETEEEQGQDTDDPEAAAAEPGSEEEEPEDDDDGEVDITIGDATPASEEEQARTPAPEWVKDLRKEHRETQRENRELRKRLAAMETPKSEEIKVGPKPQLSDFDYDEEAHTAAILEWDSKRRQAEAKKKEAEAEQEQQAKAWTDRLAEYGDMKSKLRVKDFEEAEEVVTGTLNQVQQGIIVQGTENPAMVVYALGKNDAEAKKLAAITDPVKFAVAIGKLEDKLRVKPRQRPKTKPEKQIKGDAPISGTVDSTLEKLRAEAERTGDYTKVSRYRKEQKRKAAG